MMTDQEQSQWVCENKPEVWVAASQYWMICKNSKILFRRPKDASLKVQQKELEEAQRLGRERRGQKQQPPKSHWSKDKTDVKKASPTGGEKVQPPGAAQNKTPQEAAKRRVEPKVANLNDAQSEHASMVYAALELPEGVRVKALAARNR